MPLRSREERKMVARVYLCMHRPCNDVFDGRVDGIHASLDTSSKLGAFSLAKYKRTVSLFGMADTFTHIKPAVRASRHTAAHFTSSFCAREFVSAVTSTPPPHYPKRPRDITSALAMTTQMGKKS
jgi:hypothetical protein